MSAIPLTVLYIHQDEIDCAKVSAISLTILYIHQTEINCAKVSAIALIVLYIYQAEINWGQGKCNITDCTVHSSKMR